MSDKTELLPCPFCGSDDIEVHMDEHELLGGWFGTAKCGSCDAVGSIPEIGETEDKAFLLAVSAWNERSSVSEATPSSSPAPADLTGTAASLAEIIDAMDRYQQAVDTDAPADHRAMMERARKALSAARAVAPAGVPEHAANVARTLGEFADALDADEPLNTENLIDAMRDAVDALLSPKPAAQGMGWSKALDDIAADAAMTLPGPAQGGE